MKNIMILLTLLVSFHAFAGNGGGTMGMEAEPLEMIYSMGNDGEYMNYVRATWENGEWFMKKESLVLRDFDSPVHNAIKESDAMRNWAEVERK